MKDTVWNRSASRHVKPTRRRWGGVLEGRVHWAGVEWPVLLVALTLLATGVTFVAVMADVDSAMGREDVRFDAHMKKIAITMSLVAFGMLVRPRWLRRNTWWIYGASLVLLALVPLIGEERNSAKRWIPTPVFDVQPSEFAKLALVLVLARVLYRCRLERPGEWIGPAFLALLPMGMVAAQPDLGTALTIVPVTLGMFYLAGASGRWIGWLVLLGAVTGFCAWKFEWVQEYQLRRIDTWVAAMEPEQLIDDKNGDAFHLYMATVSVGNGGLRGTGLGGGIANQAAHLPERESDSIFAVIAEEGGFVGAGLVVLLYTVMVVMMFAAAGRIRERFSRLVVGGVALYFASHFFINVGVNLGLVPMTGLTLPLLSTGGSSLLVTFAALGLALGLGAHAEPSLDEDAFRG